MSLLQQDKDYLNRQVSDLSNRRGFLEEKMTTLTEQVDGAKQSREEMYEKYVASRYAFFVLEFEFQTLFEAFSRINGYIFIIRLLNTEVIICL